MARLRIQVELNGSRRRSFVSDGLMTARALQATAGNMRPLVRASTIRHQVDKVCTLLPSSEKLRKLDARTAGVIVDEMRWNV